MSRTEKELPFSPAVIRSDRKTLGLQVDKEGNLIVRAPKRVGAREIEAAILKHAAWIEKAQKAQRERAAAHPAPTEEETVRLKAAAKEILPQKVRYYAALMGVQPARVTVTAAKTRYGSCTAKNALSFSCYLMRCPEPAVDYVVVHELAHIRHHDHSPAFWAEVEKWMPDYKERRAMLRK